jgi:serine protease Do
MYSAAILPLILFTLSAAAQDLRPMLPRLPLASAFWAMPPQEAARGRGSYLGVFVRDITRERMQELKLSQERGAEITMVDQDSPAGKAGLKEQDVIVSFNSSPVESTEQLRRLIRETPPERSVTLGISRNGQALTRQVQLSARSRRLEIPDVKLPRMGVDLPGFSVLQYCRRNGLVVENLTPQLGEYFGVKGGQGVLVRSVENGTPAQAAGFKAGDVILRVAGEQVANAADWNRLIRRQAGKTVNIEVLRERQQKSLSFAVPEPPGGGGAAKLERLLPKLEAYFEQLSAEIERKVSRHMRGELEM